VKEGKVKQLLAKEAGYARRENKNLGMGGEKGPCYFELNESFQSPNTASFPDITLTPCTWFILPYKVANENR